MDEAPDYAFPHSADDESRRLELFEERLDPLTRRRIEQLSIGPGARCLEIGGGRGSIARWLSERVGPEGHVTVTDLQLGFLEALDASNVEVLRHDVRTDTFPEGTFDLVHARAVLMHVPDDLETLRRMASWLRAEWLAVARRAGLRHVARRRRSRLGGPSGRLASHVPGRLACARPFTPEADPQLDLVDVGADAEVDVIEAGTSLAEFYRLSMVAIGPPAVEAGALTAAQAAALAERPAQPDFLDFGFVHVGVRGRRPAAP